MKEFGDKFRKKLRESNKRELFDYKEEGATYLIPVYEASSIMDEFMAEYADLFEELEGLKKAREEGLLITLPCPIGAMVYRVVDVCNGDSYSCTVNCSQCPYNDVTIKPEEFNLETLKDINKNVFVTIEGAVEEMKRKIKNTP